MSKKTMKAPKLIVTSILSMVMCGSLIAGATFALFTSESQVSIAVTSGKVNVDAKIKDGSLITYSAKVATADEVEDAEKEGSTTVLLEDEHSNKYVYEEKKGTEAGTFTNGGVATLDKDGNLILDRITPGDKVTFDITVTNNSNVAIQYRTTLSSALKNSDIEDNADSQQNLIAALQTSFTVNNSEGDSATYIISTAKQAQTDFSGVISYTSEWLNWTKTNYNMAETSTITVEISLPIDTTKDYSNIKTELTFAIEAVQGNAATSGEEEFYGVGSTREVAVGDTNYEIQYNEDGITLLSCKTETGDVVIPSEIDGIAVTEIASEAFSLGYTTNNGVNTYILNETITSVTIPSSVTKIGDYAFAACTKLTSVTLKDGLETIGENAFTFCRSLTNITIPDSVTTIEDGAFWYCTELETVTLSKNITAIPAKAFDQCDSLKSIVIPEGVTEIGAEAFLSCGDDGKGLSEVVLPSTVKVIGANAFATNHALKSVTLNEGLEEIGTEAFYGTLLATENLTIPSTVTAIGNSAFEGTNISGKLTIPDSVTNIGSNAFAYCSYLTEVDVGTGLTTIQNFTFGGCAGLKTINLPANITKIGSGAFAIVEESTGNTEFTINYAGKADVWESMVDLSKTQSSLVIQLIAEFGSFEAGAKLILGDSYTDEAASKLYEDLSTGKGGYAYNYLIPDCPLYYALQDTLTAQTINVVCGYNAETKTGDTTITYTWNSETNTYDVTTETKTTD